MHYYLRSNQQLLSSTLLLELTLTDYNEWIVFQASASVLNIKFDMLAQLLYMSDSHFYTYLVMPKFDVHTCATLFCCAIGTKGFNYFCSL